MAKHRSVILIKKYRNIIPIITHQIGEESGDTCHRLIEWSHGDFYCKGILQDRDNDHYGGCSCHTGFAPCSSCTAGRIECPDCGWEEEDA